LIYKEHNLHLIYNYPSATWLAPSYWDVSVSVLFPDRLDESKDGTCELLLSLFSFGMPVGAPDGAPDGSPEDEFKYFGECN